MALSVRKESDPAFDSAMTRRVVSGKELDKGDEERRSQGMN